jgi:hypothetical protein
MAELCLLICLDMSGSFQHSTRHGILGSIQTIAQMLRPLGSSDSHSMVLLAHLGQIKAV